MGLFEHPAYAGHELVVGRFDAASGLRAIIAIHDRTLGPAAGGCRMWPYPDSTAALADVLRLSAAMTYKNALAGLPLGGGKSVILGDPQRVKTPQLLAAFGGWVEELGGRYWTAEDVGIGIADVEVIANTTRYTFGLQKSGLKTGDPSPFTALGCFHGMRAAVRHRLGRPDLEGIRVAVQGVGSVGYELCKLLHAAGAGLTVADVDGAAAQRAGTAFGALVVTPETIVDADVDVFAPCALGATVNPVTLGRLRAVVVAGVANNQLSDPHQADELARRDILYAPDYVVNAGGMHNASGDILGRHDVLQVRQRIAAIYDLCGEIFERAKREGRSTAAVADTMARERIRLAGRAVSA